MVRLFFWVVAVLLISVPLSAGAETHVVVVRDPFILPSFFPQDITINEGDTVRWDWDPENADEHDVRAGDTPDMPETSYHESFVSPLAVTGINFEWVFDRDYLNTFPATGNLYKYFCVPHWAMGMVGSVTVVRQPKPFTAALAGWQVIPATGSNLTGDCSLELDGEETQVTITCSDLPDNTTTLELRNATLGADGELLCSIDASSGVSNAICPLTSTKVEELWEGRTYLQALTSGFPSGEIRGQIVHANRTADISGNVSLDDGQGIVGALVAAGGKIAATNTSGDYTLVDVPNGAYQLSASKPGLTITPNIGTNPVLVNNANSVLRNFSAALGGPTGSGPDADGDCVSDDTEIADGSNPNDRGSFRQHVRSPVYALWNGFIGLINILELINKSDSASIPATVRLYDIDGNQVHQVGVTISPRGQVDLIINDMPGFSENSYGIVTVEFAANFDDLLDGRLTYYRNASNGSGFEFAFGVPFIAPMCGTTYTGFNTFQPSVNPSELNNEVAQWLSVVNLDSTTTKSFTIRRRDQGGNILNSNQVTVPPFGRIDVDGGHLAVGPNHVGVNEVIPDDASAPYLAELFRYGGNAPVGVAPTSYSFAFPLLGRAGTGETFYVPISSGSGAENWLEVLNASAQTTNVTLQFNNNDGDLLNETTLTLAPYAQQHVFASGFLASGASGSAKIIPAATESIVAQSMFYFRDSSTGSILAMYGSQGREAFGTQLFGSYNLFLGPEMFNWLKVVNTTDTQQSVTLTVYNPSTSPVQQLLTLPSRGGVDLGLHDSQFGTSSNTFGIVQLDTATPKGVFAELLRLRTVNSEIDFAAPTEVR